MYLNDERLKIALIVKLTTAMLIVRIWSFCGRVKVKRPAANNRLRPERNSSHAEKQSPKANGPDPKTVMRTGSGAHREQGRHILINSQIQ